METKWSRLSYNFFWDKKTNFLEQIYCVVEKSNLDQILVVLADSS
jgi:hypothetical protein